MSKTKTLALVLACALTALAHPALASGNIMLPEATFEAEETASIETTSNPSEVSELKSTIETLKAELAEMKSGMKQLQTKMVEAEMAKLQEQLQAIQTDTTPVSYKEDLNLLPTANLLGADLLATSTEDRVAEGAEAITEDDLILVDDAAIAEEIAQKYAEIEELEAVLQQKETADEAKSTEAEAKEEIAEAEEMKAELETVEVTKVIEQLTGEEDTETEAVVEEKNSNIIAQANGEILFQFPRSISTKEQKSAISADDMTADVLHMVETTLEHEEKISQHKSATPEEDSFFSASNIALLGALLGVAIVVSIIWLIRNEKKLLAATSRRFRKINLAKDSSSTEQHSRD